MKRFLMMMALIGLVGNWNSTLTAQLVSPRSNTMNRERRGLTRDKHCRRETLDKGGGG